LVGHQEDHPTYKKIEQWGVDVVIYLECGADFFVYGPVDATAIPKPHLI